MISEISRIVAILVDRMIDTAIEIMIDTVIEITIDTAIETTIAQKDLDTMIAQKDLENHRKREKRSSYCLARIPIPQLLPFRPRRDPIPSVPPNRGTNSNTKRRKNKKRNLFRQNLTKNLLLHLLPNKNRLRMLLLLLLLPRKNGGEVPPIRIKKAEEDLGVTEDGEGVIAPLVTLVTLVILIAPLVAMIAPLVILIVPLVILIVPLVTLVIQTALHVPMTIEKVAEVDMVTVATIMIEEEEEEETINADPDLMIEIVPNDRLPKKKITRAGAASKPDLFLLDQQELLLPTRRE